MRLDKRCNDNKIQRKIVDIGREEWVTKENKEVRECEIDRGEVY